MEGRTEQRDDGWALVLPGQADGLQNEVTGFPTHQAAAQALRLVALHAAIVAGQPPDEVQRLRGELEAHDPGCCDDEAVEELAQYSRGQLLDMLRATAAGAESDGPTVSTAAAPAARPSPAFSDGQQPFAPQTGAAGAAVTSKAAEPAAQEQEVPRPQQHELLQEPAAQPQQQAPAGPPAPAPPPQQAVLQQQGQAPALPGGFYHHFFGVAPQVPLPSVTSYKAQLALALSSGGQPQRPSKHLGGKMAQNVCLLACPTQAEAAAARDLGVLWRESRLAGPRGGGSKPRRFKPSLFNFDKSRWEQDQPELLAAVRQCATLRQLQQLLAGCMANGTLRALGSSLPRDAASWQAATQQNGSKGWRPSLKRALSQLAPGRSGSWDGLQLGTEGGAGSEGEEGGRGRRRRHVRLARSVSLTDSFGYDSEPDAGQAVAAAEGRGHAAGSTGAAQAALLALGAGQREGQGGAHGSSMDTEGIEGAAADELESDYLGVRKCPTGGWRVVVTVRLNGLAMPALDGFKCRQPFELSSELEAALVRDLGLLWFEQWCGPESFQENRLWNFALRRYLLDAPLWNALSQLPDWPSFESYILQLQTAGQLAGIAKAYDEGELPMDWPDPQSAAPEAPEQQPRPKQQRQGRRQQRQQQQQQQQQAGAGRAVPQRVLRTRRQSQRTKREQSPGVTTAEAAAAARACKAAAEAAAAVAPAEPWHELAAAWRQQSQWQAEQWEAAVPPYATDWLLQGSLVHRMLCPTQPDDQQLGQPAGGAAAPTSDDGARPAAAPAAAAVPAAAGVRAAGGAQRWRRRQQQQQQQPSGHAQQLPPKPPQAKQPTPPQVGQPQSAGEAATVMPAAAQTVASPLQQQECAPQPAEAGAPPAQQRAPHAAAAVDALPATPAEPDAQQAAASQPDGASLAELHVLLERLPVSHPLDGQSSAPRPLPPVPAAGDVLLYCRRTSGLAGLPLLERLLVLSATALDPPSPRVSHRCMCLLLAQGANAQQLDPPAAGPAKTAVEVGPSGFKAKVVAVKTKSQWSILGHVARESMDAVNSALGAAEQQQ